MPPPWKPPSPPRPADPARLAAMCARLILALRGPEACEPSGDEIADGLLGATRRLGAGDRDRLQGLLDAADDLNQGKTSCMR